MAIIKKMVKSITKRLVGWRGVSKIFKIKSGETEAALAERRADKERRPVATTGHKGRPKATEVFVGGRRGQKKNGPPKDRKKQKQEWAAVGGRPFTAPNESIGGNKNFPSEENGRPDGLWVKASEKRSGREASNGSRRRRNARKDNAKRLTEVGASGKKKKERAAGRKGEASDAAADGDLEDVGGEGRLT
jgi:hypothetical protein